MESGLSPPSIRMNAGIGQGMQEFSGGFNRNNQTNGLLSTTNNIIGQGGVSGLSVPNNNTTMGGNLSQIQP